MDEIRFDEAEHRYFLDTTELPSVTSILHSMISFDRVSPFVLERKRAIGKACHRAIELYLQHQLDDATVDPEVWPYLESFIRFAALKPMKLVAAEQIVFSKTHRYAGRFDLVVTFDDSPAETWLLDAKAVYSMSPTTALQTAAYAEAYRECAGTKINKRAGLQLQADGGAAKLYPYESKSDFLVFLNATNLHRWVQNHRK